jgi:hypothetical protein
MDPQAQAHLLCLELRLSPDPQTFLDHIQSLISILMDAPLSVISECSTLVNIHDVLNSLQYENIQPFSIALLGILGLPNNRSSETFAVYSLESLHLLAFDVVVAYLFQRIPCEYEPATQAPLMLSALALILPHGIPIMISEKIFNENLSIHIKILYFGGKQ